MKKPLYFIYILALAAGLNIGLFFVSFMLGYMLGLATLCQGEPLPPPTYPAKLECIDHPTNPAVYPCAVVRMDGYHEPFWTENGVARQRKIEL